MEIEGGIVPKKGLMVPEEVKPKIAEAFRELFDSVDSIIAEYEQKGPGGGDSSGLLLTAAVVYTTRVIELGGREIENRHKRRRAGPRWAESVTHS